MGESNAIEAENEGQSLQFNLVRG